MLALSFAQGIEDAWANVTTFVPKLGGALLTLLVGWLIARALHDEIDLRNPGGAD